MSSFDLGIADVRPLPGIAAERERWQTLAARMHRRVFLRSEGTSVNVGAPQRMTGKLREQCADLVARFDRFYARAADAFYRRPELRDEYLLNPLVEPLLALEADLPIATPLSRLDAVLSADGTVRVVELNSNGICQFHLRSLLYVIRELARDGLEHDARALDEMVRLTVTEGFLRFARARRPDLPARPVVGSLAPSGFHRAAQRLFRAAFQRAGCDYVFGGPEHLEVTDRDIRMRGTPVDVLWIDFFLYLAYQCARYQETKWPTKLPDYGQTPEQAARLLADPRFIDHLRRGRVVMLSPARSYLALPKSLLSWIHRSDRPVDDADRAVLAAHVARTYSARDRMDGLVAQPRVAAARGDYLVKPCQYGGSHGVVLGRMCDQAKWAAMLDQIWTDPNWVVQEFHDPVRTADGQFVSLGLANLGGVYGGAAIRTASSLLISARDAAFIPCT